MSRIFKGAEILYLAVALAAALLNPIIAIAFVAMIVAAKRR